MWHFGAFLLGLKSHTRVAEFDLSMEGRRRQRGGWKISGKDWSKESHTWHRRIPALVIDLDVQLT